MTMVPPTMIAGTPSSQGRLPFWVVPNEEPGGRRPKRKERKRKRV